MHSWPLKLFFHVSWNIETLKIGINKNNLTEDTKEWLFCISFSTILKLFFDSTSMHWYLNILYIKCYKSKAKDVCEVTGSYESIIETGWWIIFYWEFCSFGIFPNLNWSQWIKILNISASGKVCEIQHRLKQWLN